MTSVSQLEQDIAATRNRLHATIDRIQEKLTVAGMVDEVVGQVGIARVAGGEGTLLTMMRRHPLPVLLAAAGVGFLIYRMNRAEATRRSPLLDEDLVEVPAINDGQARLYDPDTSPRHPTTEPFDRRRIEA